MSYHSYSVILVTIKKVLLMDGELSHFRDRGRDFVLGTSRRCRL